MERNEVDIMLEYRNFTIYNKYREFTVGGVDNSEFDDCTLENLRCEVDETNMVAWNMKNGNNLRFYNFRQDGDEVTYKDYIEHFVDYDGDKCFIVPAVYFSTIEKAKEFIDWIIDGNNEGYSLNEEIQKAKEKAHVKETVEGGYGLKTSDLIKMLQESLELNGDLEVVGIAMGDIYPYVDINCPGENTPLYIELAE